MVVPIGQHAADHQRRRLAATRMQVVGEIDQGRREDVGDDDVERPVDSAIGVVRDLDPLSDPVCRGVGVRGAEPTPARCRSRRARRCAEQARRDAEHARTAPDVEHRRTRDRALPRMARIDSIVVGWSPEPERRAGLDRGSARPPGRIRRTEPTPDRPRDPSSTQIGWACSAPRVGHRFVDLDESPRPSGESPTPRRSMTRHDRRRARSTARCDPPCDPPRSSIATTPSDHSASDASSASLGSRP